jgi:hypothetical protein
MITGAAGSLGSAKPDHRVGRGRGRGRDRVVARRELGHQLEQRHPWRLRRRERLEHVGQPAPVALHPRLELVPPCRRGEVAQAGGVGGRLGVLGEQQQQGLADGRAQVGVEAQRLLDGARCRHGRCRAARRAARHAAQREALLGRQA